MFELDYCSPHSDSAQLLLNLVGHHVRPVFLPQEVPEDPTNESVGPGGVAHPRRLRRLTGALYARVKDSRWNKFCSVAVKVLALKRDSLFL